jgi:hypothetical protein
MESFSPDARQTCSCWTCCRTMPRKATSSWRAGACVSPTCLRRVKRLHTRADRAAGGHRAARPAGRPAGPRAGVHCGNDARPPGRRAWLDAFEARAVQEPCVQQCWRVSPGPDFVLVLHTRDMPSYLALSQRLFTGTTPMCAMCAPSLRPTGQNLRQKCLYRPSEKRNMLLFL